MDPRKLFSDERLGRYGDFCVYCGGRAETKDHVPSEILLDKPYPPDLPKVGACRNCNLSFSKDENYLACFLECAVCGSTEPDRLERKKIVDSLEWSPALKKAIQDSCRRSMFGDFLLWEAKSERVKTVLAKLAKGHAAYELYPLPGAEEKVFFESFTSMSKKDREKFEDLQSVNGGLIPEIGSRSYFEAEPIYPGSMRIINSWRVVQKARYRYAAIEADDGILVRMVLREYLAGEVLLRY